MSSIESVLLCSDCFQNEGLRYEARKIGIQTEIACPRCSSVTGLGFDRDALATLMETFFVAGSQSLGYPSVFLMDYGQLWKEYGHEKINFDETLNSDYQLLTSLVEHLRYRSASLRMLGISWLLEDLVDGLKATDSGDVVEGSKKIERVVNEVLGRTERVTLEAGQKLYRIRTNPREITSPLHIDTPPPAIENDYRSSGRFDSIGVPIMYTSLDVETCLHEARTKVGDEIVLGSMEITRPQRLIDFSTLVIDKQAASNHDNADVFYFLRRCLTSQDPLSYRLCQTLSHFVRASGLDGIIHKSFFSIVRPEPGYNAALFGFPIREERCRHLSWNSIQIRKLAYEFQFGPMSHILYGQENKHASQAP